MLYRAPVADDEALEAHFIFELHDVLLVFMHLHAVEG